MKINKDDLSKKAKEAASKAKDKFQSAAEQVKKHDFRADMNDIAGEAKNLPNNWREFDVRNALRETAAEAKENPSSLWSKPETLRKGKHFAFAGLALAVISLVVLLFTSNAFIGIIFLIASVAGLCYSVVGLKTEGRNLATGSTIASVLAVILAICQMMPSSNTSEDGENTERKETVIAKENGKAHSSGGGGENTGKKGAVIVKKKGSGQYQQDENRGVAASSVDAILSEAKNAKKVNSLNFNGFYTGMSYTNAMILVSHYGLQKGDLTVDWNKVNGEICMLKFSARALDKIMDIPNNLETASDMLLDYFGIVEWNNQKQIVEGEIDSIFQDDAEKLFLGDAADKARWYKNADDIYVTLYPAGFKGKGTALVMRDVQRKKLAVKNNRAFEANRIIPAYLKMYKDQGVKTKIIHLPDGVDLVLNQAHGEIELGNSKTDALWIGMPFTAHFAAVYGEPRDIVVDEQPVVRGKDEKIKIYIHTQEEAILASSYDFIAADNRIKVGGSAGLLLNILGNSNSFEGKRTEVEMAKRLDQIRKSHLAKGQENISLVTQVALAIFMDELNELSAVKEEGLGFIYFLEEKDQISLTAVDRSFYEAHRPENYKQVWEAMNEKAKKDSDEAMKKIIRGK